MNYKTVGNSGLKVSELCLGTMTFGKGFHGIGEVDQKGANELVARALEAGVNCFDTADVYSLGESEQILGSALKEAGVMRDSVVIATKVRGAMSESAQQGTGDINNVGLSRKHIIQACEASLKRLGTDYIDLYQVHGWDALTPLEESLRALDDLVRQGKVRYIGCSNYASRHIMKSLHISETLGLQRFVSLQAFYSLANRDLEYELLPLCREEGLGVFVWSPLAGGFLTGKFHRGEKQGPAGTRRAGFDFPPIDKELGYQVVEELGEMARAKQSTVPQLALAWLLRQKGVSTVIIGAKRMSQLEDNLKATELSFSQEEYDRLLKLTALKPLYPFWMIQLQGESRRR